MFYFDLECSDIFGKFLIFSGRLGELPPINKLLVLVMLADPRFLLKIKWLGAQPPNPQVAYNFQILLYFYPIQA